MLPKVVVVVSTSTGIRSSRKKIRPRKDRFPK